MPNLDKLGPALCELRKAAEPKMSALAFGRRMGLRGEDQTVKNRMAGIESEGKPYPNSTTIDLYLHAARATWLDLGRMIERLAAAGGAPPSASLRGDRIAADAEAGLEDLIQRTAGEAADRAAERVIERLRDGLQH